MTQPADWPDFERDSTESLRNKWAEVHGYNCDSTECEETAFVEGLLSARESHQ